MKYFSYSDGRGFERHATSDEARKSAEDELEWERDQADNGWSEEVTSICWGTVQEAVRLLSSIPTEPDSAMDSYDEYGLSEVEP